jgi:hypothetical protein
MTQKTIPENLLLKPGKTLLLIHPPDGYLESLGELPAFSRIVPFPGPADVVQLFIRSYAELEAELPGARSILRPESVFWICYPKQTGKLKTDINRDILYEYAVIRNLKGIGMFSIDNNWSAMRFKNQ